MDTKERKTPVQDTCPAPGPVRRTQSWRPAPPQAAKIELEKPKSISRGCPQNFFGSFSWLILGYRSCREARPCDRATALAEQARQPAMVFGWQVRIVEQFSAMQNDPPLALHQEATNWIFRGRGEPPTGGWRPYFGLQSHHGPKKDQFAQCGPRFAARTAPPTGSVS